MCNHKQLCDYLRTLFLHDLSQACQWYITEHFDTAVRKKWLFKQCILAWLTFLSSVQVKNRLKCCMKKRIDVNTLVFNLFYFKPEMKADKKINKIKMTLAFFSSPPKCTNFFITFVMKNYLLRTRRALDADNMYPIGGTKISENHTFLLETG